MGRIRIEDFHGLYTWGGIRRRPQGTVFQGTNFNVEAPGVIRSRVGIGSSTNGCTSSVLSVHPTSTNADMNNVVVECYDGQLRLYGASGTVSVLDATFNAANIFQNGRRTTSARGLENLYLTTANGVKRYDGSTVAFAGAPRAQSYRQRNAGAPGNQLVGGVGILPNLSSRAYRFTIHTFDAAGAEIAGPPSGRLLIINDNGTTGHTGGALDPVPAALLSNQVGVTTALTASFYIRTWASRTSTGTPDDEMYLLDEHQITSTDISNGYYKFTDAISDTLLVTGTRLNTNAGDYQPPEPVLSKGIVNEDARPPRGYDIASWRGRTWFGGALVEFNSVALVMLTNPADGDTITVNGQALTFKTAPTLSTHVQIETGYGSASSNIDATTGNLVDQLNINRVANTVEAQFMGGTSSSFPGQLLLRSVTGLTYPTIAVSAAAKWQIGAWQPPSSSHAGGNTIAFSKLGRPDAVPPINRLVVNADVLTSVLRLIPLRDFLYVFTNAGVFRVSGTDATNFSVELFDSTAKLVGAQLVAVVDDRIYAWCTQGICAIDSAGVEWISQPIEPTLRNIIETISTTNPYAMAVQAFAAPFQARHRVLFFYPATAYSNGTPLGNLGCANALVFDTRVHEWSAVNDGSATFSCASDNRIDIPIFGDSQNPDAAGHLWTFNAGTTLNDYRDTLPGGAFAAFDTSFTLAIQAPEGVSSPHWQEVAIALERDLIRAARVPPTNLIVTFYSPDLGTTVSVSAGTTDQTDYRRVLVPQVFRNAPTLIFKVATDTATASGPLFMGVECIDIYYGDVAKGTVRK